MLAQIQHTQPPLHHMPSPSVSNTERPSHPFACRGCSERSAPSGGTRTTSPLPACRGGPCKGKIKGHGKKDQRHHQGTSTTHSGLYFMPAVLASVRSPLWVREVSDACLGGLPSSPSLGTRAPKTNHPPCTKKGTKPMPWPPHYKPTTAPRPGTGISCAESTAQPAAASYFDLLPPKAATECSMPISFPP